MLIAQISTNLPPDVSTAVNALLPPSISGKVTSALVLLMVLGRVWLALENDPTVMGIIKSVFKGSSSTTTAMPNNSTTPPQPPSIPKSNA